MHWPVRRVLMAGMVRTVTRRNLLASAAAPLLAAGRKPNIVFIISDDHHWQCVGANGNPYIRTPNIDKLASRGVNFTQGIISSSQCAPSRGVLLSGVECYQNGLDSNGHTGFRSFRGRTVVPARENPSRSRSAPRSAGSPETPLRRSWLRSRHPARPLPARFAARPRSRTCRLK